MKSSSYSSPIEHLHSCMRDITAERAKKTSSWTKCTVFLVRVIEKSEMRISLSQYNSVIRDILIYYVNV